LTSAIIVADDSDVRPRRDHDRRLLGYARNMRRECTDAERKLWNILRDRQLAEFKFRRQYPVAGYILDFYCVRCRLAVEADGGQHNDVEQREYDERRSGVLAGIGVTVLRFADDQILKHPDAVAGAIYNEIALR
jgi:type I restriction enzyme M protein